MKKVLGIFLLLVSLFTATFSLSGCGKVPESPGKETEVPVYYRNPIVEKDMADPHIIKHESTYYIFSTGGKIHKSTDTIAWTEVEGGVNIKPVWGTKGAGFWAPDIVKIGNKFVLYYSLSTWGDANPGIGVATADSPEGVWTDHGKLFTSSEIGVNNSIDPSVFIGQDNRVYMIWGSFRGLFGVELTADGLGLMNGIDYARDNKVLIAGEVGEWDGATFEAAYVIYKDGFYYLFASSGTCCDGLKSTYHVKLGRSTTPLGDYRDSTGASMKGRNVGHLVLGGNDSLMGPGHNSVFIDDKGDYFIVYHTWKNVDGVGKGRYLALDRLVWTDGWAQVKNKMPSVKAVVPYMTTDTNKV